MIAIKFSQPEISALRSFLSDLQSDDSFPHLARVKVWRAVANAAVASVAVVVLDRDGLDALIERLSQGIEDGALASALNVLCDAAEIQA